MLSVTQWVADLRLLVYTQQLLPGHTDIDLLLKAPGITVFDILPHVLLR